MTLLEIVTPLHTGTQRDYLQRVTEFPKAEAAARAKLWGFDYWDGDRRIGYGGYRYDGRWRPVAEDLVRHYGLEPGKSVLDVGCGKGFLLHDLSQLVPGLRTYGIDISGYALAQGYGDIRNFLARSTASCLPFPTDAFDLVISINVLHNLHTWDLHRALTEIQRIGDSAFVVVESYRSEQEKANLLYWQLTCEQFCTPDEWIWWFDLAGYSGDYEFIFFE